jgi:WD40 repeat protein
MKSQNAASRIVTTRLKHIQARKLKLVSQSQNIEIKLQSLWKTHSKNEDSYKEDHTTPVYGGIFLPVETADNPQTNRIGCTVGGHKVCFIDSQSGKVIKIFQANPSESFYSVAASYIENYCILPTAQPENSTIVAAAGKDRDIKLIHFQRNECYAVLESHSGNINELCFSPKNPVHLLSKFFEFAVSDFRRVNLL